MQVGRQKMMWVSHQAVLASIAKPARVAAYSKDYVSGKCTFMRYPLLTSAHKALEFTRRPKTQDTLMGAQAPDSTQIQYAQAKTNSFVNLAKGFGQYVTFAAGIPLVVGSVFGESPVTLVATVGSILYGLTKGTITLFRPTGLLAASICLGIRDGIEGGFRNMGESFQAQFRNTINSGDS